MYVEAPRPIALTMRDINEAKSRDEQGSEEIGEGESLIEIDDQARAISYGKELDDLTKINIAFKTLQVLGQVLRDFPTVLRGELKTEVAP